MRSITVNLYSYNELSEKAKETAREYVRNNWHDLAQHIIDEVIDSLNGLAREVNGKLDYSISAFPDRGEFIKITEFNAKKLTKEAIKEYEKTKGYDVDYLKRQMKGV